PYKRSKKNPIFSFYQYPGNGPIKLPNPIVVVHERASAAGCAEETHPTISVLSLLSLDEQADPSNAKQIRLIAPLSVLRHPDVGRSFVEPSLFVFIHDDYGGAKKCSVVRDKVVRKGPPEWFKGMLEVGTKKKKVQFACFMVPLNEFSKDRVEKGDADLAAIIDDKIVQRLGGMLSEF
ncbi:hypothetical protein CH330_06460, partial [candidate division WOR-3 bacterium JGI_Cruoil_03_51_56]